MLAIWELLAIPVVLVLVVLVVLVAPLCAGWGIFALLWCLFFHVVRRGRPRPSLGWSVLVYAVLVVVGCVAMCWPEEPFEHAFGFPTPKDVVILREERDLHIDFRYTFLAFRASRGTIDRIVRRGLKADEDASGCPNSNVPVPGWWKMPSGPAVRYYSGHFENQEGRLANESEFLAYDSRIGIAWFHRVGVD